jgi:hypothetical protein
MFLRNVGELHRTTRRHIQGKSTFAVTAARHTNAVALISLTKPVTRNVPDMWGSHGGGYDVTIYQTTRHHIPEYISINTDRTLHTVPHVIRRWDVVSMRGSYLYDPWVRICFPFDDQKHKKMGLFKWNTESWLALNCETQWIILSVRMHREELFTRYYWYTRHRQTL